MGQSQHIGVLAGEKSGDILGRGVRELTYIVMLFSGIGGEQMALHGLTSLHDMERLSVFGLVEPLKRLPELLSIRRSVGADQQSRSSFGIDSPDFNGARQAYRNGIEQLTSQPLGLGVAPEESIDQSG